MRLWIAALLFLLPSLAIAEPLDLSSLGPENRAKLQRLYPRLQEGQMSPAELDALIRHLITDEKFDSAEIVRKDVNGRPVEILRVGRVQKIKTLHFQGDSAISESDVRREFGVQEGAAFDQQTLIDAAERVRKYYEDLGYAQARVDLEFRPQKDDGVQVDVKVIEGAQTTIQDFEIVADNPEFKDKLLRRLRGWRGFVGEPINEKTLSELRNRIRDFLASHHYYRAEVQDPQIERTKEASKSKLIYRFANSDEYLIDIEGNQRESRSSLNEAMSLDSFTSSNPNVGNELGSKVKNYYISEGYARADVHIDEHPSTHSPHVRVIEMKINEGPRVKIKSIDWVGRYSENSRFYSDFVKDHSSETVHSGYYVKDDIDLGLKNLLTDRWNQGFLKAKIVSTRTSYNQGKNEITLQVNFDEGPLTQIRSIKFAGNQQMKEGELRDLLEFKEGEPLKLNRLEDSVTKLKRYYRSHGFLEMAITNEKQDLVQYNNDNTLVDVHFQIYEGPQVRVGSIVIEGNTITKEYVIYKELEFRVGEILTPEAIDESTARLQRLGHFSSVEIKTLEENTPTAIRTVLIRVSDRNPGLFLLGFGVNNDRILTLRGYAGVSYRNIGGMGRGVSARADVNYNTAVVKYPERKLTLGYLEPYLFDSRMRGRVNLTQAFTVSPQFNDLGSELKQTTFTIEQDISSHLLFSWDLISIAHFRDFKVPSEEDITVLDIGSTGPTLDIDFRDHPFNPTRGTFTRLNLEYGSPWLGSNKTIEYYRAFGSFTHYQSLGIFGIVWANSLRGGYIHNLSDIAAGGSIPFDKKGFLLGGESTIRGFTPGEAFPNQNNFYGFPLSDYDPVAQRYNLRTDATMYLLKSEVRFPIYKNFAGALFYDGGAVFIQNVSFDRPYRDAFGIAARYNTPVGPLSLEYGWKIKPRCFTNGNCEAPSVFNVAVGAF